MAAPATLWWEREPPASSQEDKSRNARAIIAGMCEVLRPHVDRELPPLHDTSRQATVARCAAIHEVLRKCDFEDFCEIVDRARSRALGSSPLDERRADALDSLGLTEDMEAGDVPSPAPRFANLAATREGDLRDLERIVEAAKGAGLDPERGGVA